MLMMLFFLNFLKFLIIFSDNRFKRKEILYSNVEFNVNVVFSYFNIS